MSKNQNSSLPPRASKLVRSARVAHLSTADKSGAPHVMPICFVFDGKTFYSPIDEKPKRTTKLKRLKNIAENPQIALVIDHYEEDWHRLVYVLCTGSARLLHRGAAHAKAVRSLRRKYPQYRAMALDQSPMIALTPKRIISWDSRGGDSLNARIKKKATRSEWPLIRIVGRQSQG